MIWKCKVYTALEQHAKARCWPVTRCNGEEIAHLYDTITKENDKKYFEESFIEEPTLFSGNRI
jgi:transketolase N-terminal domain/subunit